MIPVRLTVNGTPHDLDVASNVTLLELLRGSLQLTGAKEGCGVGDCGTCLVLVDGEPVSSCLVLAVDADGCTVETIEGLAHDSDLDPLQAAFVEHGAIQCGYCTPAMVLAAAALLRRSPEPDAVETDEALAGVLCRCGTYPKVREAIRAAARAEAAAGTGVDR